MKKILALLLVLAMVFTLVACGENGGDTESTGGNGESTVGEKDPVTLKVASWRTEDEAIYAEIIKRFEEKYDWIDVEIELNPDQTSYYQNLEADLMEGTAPDVFDFHSKEAYVQYAKSGMFLSQEGLSYLENYQDGALAISSVDGTNYAFVNAYNMLCILYNKDIFTENNLSVPATFDEFVTLVHKLQDLGYGGVAYPGGAAGTSWLFNAMMTINLGSSGYKDLIEGMDSGKYTDITQIDGVETALKTIEAYRDNGLFYTASDSMDLTQEMALFAQGKTALMYNGTWVFGTKETDFPDINAGVFAIPTLANSGVNYAESAQMTVINAATKNEEAAKLWVDFIASVEISSYYCSNAKMTSTIEGVTLDYEGGDVLAELASQGINMLPTYTRNYKDYWDTNWKYVKSELQWGTADYETVIKDYVDFLTELNLAVLNG